MLSVATQRRITNMDATSSSAQPVSSDPRPVHRRYHTTDADLRGSASPNMSSNSSSESEEQQRGSRKDKSSERLKRPKLGQRHSSSTIIVPRDAPNIELTDEEYGPGDARTMSPRRTSEEVDRLGENARQALLLYVDHLLMLHNDKF